MVFFVKWLESDKDGAHTIESWWFWKEKEIGPKR